MLLLQDEDILAAQAELVRERDEVVEPAGGAGLAVVTSGHLPATLLEGRDERNPLRVAVVVSGEVLNLYPVLRREELTTYSTLNLRTHRATVFKEGADALRLVLVLSVHITVEVDRRLTRGLTATRAE